MWNAASAIIRVRNRSFCGFHRHRLWRLNITRMYLTGMDRTVSGNIRHRLSFWQKNRSFFYEGAPVCQDFGNTNFYYCSTMMNCIYDCSYCYLKGMYPSGHMVLFVNIEDYLEELDHILKTQNMYVCISYDADLLAMEAVTGYVRLWSAYAAKHENLKLEIRTKCASHAMWDLPCLSNVIYAFTLSPQRMIDAFEKETPSAFARIVCAAEGLKKDFRCACALIRCCICRLGRPIICNC